MTEKLFWQDAYLKEFEAKVLEIRGKEVVLDRTAFYGRSGGQPGDTGEINGIRVLDTYNHLKALFFMARMNRKALKAQLSY